MPEVILFAIRIRADNQLLNKALTKKPPLQHGDVLGCVR
jgi:hypothetical protein